jgi:hypothetical protein
MKKGILFFFVLFLCVFNIKAQVNLNFNIFLGSPANGYEHMGWVSTNMLQYDGAPQTVSTSNQTSVVTSQRSIILETVHCPTCPAINNDIFPNLTDTLRATIFQTFKVTNELPSSLNVTYRTNLQGNDLPAFRLRAWKWINNSRVYYGEKVELFPASASWATHQFDMDYLAGIPVPIDSFEIAITSSGSAFTSNAPAAQVGSTFTVDYIELITFDINNGVFPLAPCQADSNLISQSSGFWPDSTTNLPVADYDDYFYTTSIQLQTSKDTLVTFINGLDTLEILYSISNQRLNGIIGLPSGFIVSPNYNTNNRWQNSGVSPNYNSLMTCIDLFAYQDDIKDAYYNPSPNASYPLNLKFSYFVESYQCLSNCNSPYLQFLNSLYLGKWVDNFSFNQTAVSPYNFLELVINNNNNLANCNLPVNFDSVQVYSDSAFVKWSTSSDINHWNLHITPLGSPFGSGTNYFSNENKFTFNNLNEGTAYDFYIQNNCGGGNVGSWEGPFNFVTNYSSAPSGACVITGALSGNGFSLFPDSATNLTLANVNIPYYQQSIEINTPTENTFEVEILNGTISTIELQIAKVRLAAINGLPQGFSYSANYPNSQNEWINIDSLSSYISTQGCFDIYASQAAVENSLNGGPNNDGKYPLEIIFEFFNENAQCIMNCGPSNIIPNVVESIFNNKWVRLGEHDPSLQVNYYSLEIDTTSLITSNCFQPFNFNALNITGSSTNLTWGSNGNEVLWDLEFGLSGFTTGSGQLITSNVDTIHLNNLNGSSTYDVYIRANCTTDTSLWSGPYQFTTTQSQCPSQHVMFSNITDISADFSVTSGFYTVEIEYGVSGFSQGTGTLFSTPPNNSFSSLGNLNSATSYDVYARSNCTNNGMGVGNWFGPFSFTTMGIPQCVAPDSIYSFQIGDSIIAIHWDSNPLATEWNVEYGPTGFTQGSGQIISTTDTMLYLLNLDTAFNYEIYVQTVCSGSPTAWSSAFAFSPPVVVVVPPPTCNTPNNIVINYVLDTLLSFSWSNNSSNTIELEYGLSGFTLGNGTSTILTGNYSIINNLSSNTSYDFYIRAMCANNDSSSWSNVFSVTTYSSGPCFDAHSFNVNYNADTTTLSWSSYGNEISWMIEVGPEGFAQWSSGQFFYPTDTFVNILGLDTNLVYEFYISSFCVQDSTPFLGPIDLFGNGNSNPIPCLEPQSITTLSTTDSSASFTWTPGGNETECLVEYGVTGFNLGSGISQLVNQSSIIINNLDTNTTYDFYFKSICTIDSSLWVGPLVLTTDTLAIIPPGSITANVVGNSTAIISWSNNPNVALWYVQYGHQGSFDFRRSSIVYDSTYIPEYTFNNLDSGYIYEAFVKSKYLNGKVSEWSQPVIFDTFGPNLTNNNEVFDFLNIYPNPVKNTAHLNMILSNPNSIKLSILNFSGQVIYQQDLGHLGVGMHEFNIDVYDFNAGIYFFQILGNNGYVTKKMSVIK